MKDFEVNTDFFATSIRRLSALNGKAQGDLLLSFAKTTLVNRDGSGLIDLTPPGGGGVSGLGAKHRGERAIARDLGRVFAPVRLRRRAIERHPDVASIHRRLLISKRPGGPLRSDLGKQKYYVDAVKLRALSRALRLRVGRLASGWLVALHRLGGRGPGWVERHGAGPGDVVVNVAGPKKVVEMSLFARDHAPIAELERRVPAALYYTSRRIGRAIEGTLLANARRAGLKVAA